MEVLLFKTNNISFVTWFFKFKTCLNKEKLLYSEVQGEQTTLKQIKNNYLSLIYVVLSIIDMCNIKYFICDPVSVTKKLRPSQAKIKYQCALNNVSYL